jgi:hypothetical protein
VGLLDDPIRSVTLPLTAYLTHSYFGIWIVITGALILGATALTLSAGVASAQGAYVSPGWDTGIEDYNNPNETMAQLA